MKKKLLSILISIAITLSMLPGIATASPLYDIKIHREEADLELVIDTYNFIKETYPFEISDKDLSETALKAMLNSLDPYSDYYTKEEAADVYMNIFGYFTGIGIYIQKSEEYIDIINPIEGTEAEKAGLLAGDIIMSIDGKDTKDMTLDEASKLIKGTIGTKVKLVIQRKGKKLNFEITRKEITINPVKYEKLADNIGYIKLSEFSKTSSYEVKKALYYFQTEKITKIILDVRNNPGGLFDQAVEISSLFVQRGPVVHVKEKNSAPVSYFSTIIYPDKELVLLTNEKSASASEILAGAIKDRKAGTIVGKKTFGKGIIQNMIPLLNGSLIKITTAEYLTPNYISIHGIGIEPDIIVENTEDKDLQLEKAIEIIKESIE
ncbi:MAG: S41 family peptidase [Gudongella sp.]|nr:S41 family peptidase [Gudongella sp.]